MSDNKKKRPRSPNATSQPSTSASDTTLPQSSASSSDTTTTSPSSTSSSSIKAVGVHTTSPSTERIKIRTGQEEVVGQLADYATAMAHATPRTHSFMVCFFGGSARFLRWDHSATIVSEPIQLVDQAILFATVLHAFTSTSDSAKGRDSTVKLVPQKEANDISCAARLASRGCNPRLRQILTPDLVKASELRRYTVKFKDADQPVFMFGNARPTTISPTLHGRFTRGWPLFYPITKKFYWYKRVWRVENSETEAEMYVRLHKAGIKNIPTMAGNGDLPNDGPECWQRSITSHPLLRSDPPPSWLDTDALDGLQQLRQSWILLEEVGVPLTSVVSAKELITVARDATQGLTS
jgi:hypothetical protein